MPNVIDMAWTKEKTVCATPGCGKKIPPGFQPHVGKRVFCSLGHAHNFRKEKKVNV